MEKFTRKPGAYECEQFTGHPHKGDFTITQNIGVTGYGAKLGYLKIPNGNILTVRPCDWVVKDQLGKLSVMAKGDFERDFEQLSSSNSEPLAKSQKVSDNKKTSRHKEEDNAPI